MVKRLLIRFALVPAALYVAADFGARALADAGVSKELQTSLQLSSKPDVSLGGFPFIPKLVSGRFDTVEATARRFSSGGVRFARVDLTLRDVTTSTWRLLRGTDAKIGIGSGKGTATMTAQDVSDALRSAGLAVAVTFEPGRVVVRSTATSLEGSATPALRHGALVLRSRGLPSSVRIPLPAVVPGLRYTGVTIAGSRAVLSFDVRATTLDVGVTDRSGG